MMGFFDDLFNLFAPDPQPSFGHDHCCPCQYQLAPQQPAPPITDPAIAIKALADYVAWRDHFGVLTEIA